MAYLRFGLELNEQIYPFAEQIGGQLVLPCGEGALLSYLERTLGLPFTENQDYLRAEQYRQILSDYTEQHLNLFFSVSFVSDPLATASKLLAWRDELVLAGWDFALVAEMPLRLRTLAEIEHWRKEQGKPLNGGFSERFRAVLHSLLSVETLPLERLYLNEPLDLLPPHWQQLIAVLQAKGLNVIPSTEQAQGRAGSLLHRWQCSLLRQALPKNQGMKADGSILLLRAKRESDLAVFVAKILAQHPDYRPVCLLPEQDQSLDQALIFEGQPSMGLLSATMARPTLQLLRLVGAFLWKPIDPYKLLEFVSLPVKPLHHRLADRIAELLAQKPGLFSNEWQQRIEDFFQDFDRRAAEQPEKARELLAEKEAAQKQYRFWFARRRYEVHQTAPAKDFIEAFDYVRWWALELLEENKKELDNREKKLRNQKLSEDKVQQLRLEQKQLLQAQPPIFALHEQAKRLVEMLEALPEHQQQLSQLQLERLVRTINEPAPMRLQPEEVGHLPFVYVPSAITQPANEVLWWNFVATESTVGFAHWYPHEQRYLDGLGLALDQPLRKNHCRLWQRRRAALLCQDRLILCLPDRVQGRSRIPHPLLGELEAAIGKDILGSITIDIDQGQGQEQLEQWFKIPQKTSLAAKTIAKPQPYLYIGKNIKLQQRSDESYSSLDNLFYYPYQWVFKYQIGLNKSSILSVSKDHTLMGNLAHRVFEELLKKVKEADPGWALAQQNVLNWLDEYLPNLFEREGAVLLLYGKEPERINFQNRLKHATWQLVQAIHQNGWSIHGIEMSVSGFLADQQIHGIADLVLVRGEEIAVVDLKWSGLNRRKQAIQNQEDLQLVLYSRLVAEQLNKDWAHTAYFIIDSGKMVARNHQAFQQAIINNGNADAERPYQEVHEEIWERMENTYRWRMQQLAEGKIEMRSSDTFSTLDEEQQGSLSFQELNALLVMKREDAPYNDYRILSKALE